MEKFEINIRSFLENYEEQLSHVKTKLPGKGFSTFFNFCRFISISFVSVRVFSCSQQEIEVH